MITNIIIYNILYYMVHLNWERNILLIKAKKLLLEKGGLLAIIPVFFSK
jgi:hypothetical protein